MKQYIQKIREFLSDYNKVNAEIFAESIRQRAKGLEKAVHDNWFIPFLKGGELTGVVLTGVGYLTDSPSLTGFGIGIASVAGIEHVGIRYALQRRDQLREGERK